MRLIFAVLAQKGWLPHTMDIKTAFLQGQEIQRDIIIKPPNEAGVKSRLWKLKKCIYGLNDASLNWYKKVKSIMIGCGAKISSVDPAVFFWSDEEDVQGVLACHVDDFVWGGTVNFEKTVIQHIRKNLKVGKED